MLKLFRRVWAYLTASGNASFNARADPKIQLEQAISEAQEQHRRLREQAANVIAHQKQTEIRLNRTMGELEKVSGNARQAVLMADEAANSGDQAKATQYTATAESFANRLIALEREVEDLKALHLQSTDAANQAKAAVQQNSSALQAKLAERQKLLSQLDQAKMQEQMNTAMASLSEAVGQDVPTLDEVRDKIESRYARAKGMSELTESSVESRMLEVEQASMNSEAQARLSQIRAELGLAAGDGGTATGETWWTATATGGSTPSWPTSTTGVTRSTWRSRTGATTSTSAPSCATPTPSLPPACKSWVADGGTGGERWSPTSTSTSSTTPTLRTCWIGPPTPGCRSSASTTCRDQCRSRRPGFPGGACCSSARRAPACRRPPATPARRCARSPCSGPPARSTLASRRASPCTPGSANTPCDPAVAARWRRRSDHPRPLDFATTRRTGRREAVHAALAEGRGSDPRQVPAHRQGRRRHRCGPRHRRRHRGGLRRSGRRRRDLVTNRVPARGGRRPGGTGGAPGGRGAGRPLRRRRRRRACPHRPRVVRPPRRRRQQRRRDDPQRVHEDVDPVPRGGVPLQRHHRPRPHPGRRADHARRRRRRGRQHLVGHGAGERPRLPGLRHGQGGAGPLHPARGPRPGPPYPGERHRGGVGRDVGARVRAHRRCDPYGDGAGDPAPADRRSRRHRGDGPVPGVAGERLPHRQGGRGRRRPRPAQPRPRPTRPVS